MKQNGFAIVLCVVALLAASTVLAPVGAQQQDGAEVDEDDFPRAEAGLDQTVQRNASVMLDASQSFSPEGELVEYAWLIVTPDGESIYPECDSADCSLASFRAPELGQYNVTLTVADDEGRRTTDTMYVTTVPRGGFGVELTGPDTTAEEGNLTATVAPGDTDVVNITWYQRDRELGNRSLPANGGVFNRSTYVVPGATYRVEVANSWNRTVSDTWTAPDGDSWTPSAPDSDDLPRISGPSLITGSPSGVRDGDWVYDGAEYYVRTGEFMTVAENSWTVDGSSVSRGYYDHETYASPSLSPGPNLIVANLELSFTEAREYQDHDATNYSVEGWVANGSRSAMLERRVLVDPAPELSVGNVITGEERVIVKFSVEDPYDPADTLEVSIGGQLAGTVDSISSDDNERAVVPIPDGEYGSETINVRVVDGRGQTSLSAGTIQLPNMSVEDVPENIGDMPSAESSNAGYSPVFW